jgi:hypothetical protein
MQVRPRIVITAICILFLTHCARIPVFPLGAQGDISPPVIIGMRLNSPDQLTIEFDESVDLVADSVAWSATIDGTPIAQVEPCSLVFRFSAPPSPTVEHFVEAEVTDNARNRLRFAARFHGLNELLPAMVINEFTTQGSRTHPDLVEIYILSDGNLAGGTIYEGTPTDWEQRYVFPSVSVSAGDFLVVHFKPEGTVSEVNELVSKDQSDGIDASDTAWDFWVTGGSGLSGNNGILSLCENPLGGYIDAVLYSNRTSSSDEHYRGFGSSAVRDRADEIHAAGQWIAAGPMIAPEDAVDPEPSTSTRSMARSSRSDDTDTHDDWHVTPTRGLSPGAVNTDDRYSP